MFSSTSNNVLLKASSFSIILGRGPPQTSSPLSITLTLFSIKFSVICEWQSTFSMHSPLAALIPTFIPADKMTLGFFNKTTSKKL